MKPTKAQFAFLSAAARLGNVPMPIENERVARECVWNGWGHSRKSGSTGTGPECFWINARGRAAIAESKGKKT